MSEEQLAPLIAVGFLGLVVIATLIWTVIMSGRERDRRKEDEDVIQFLIYKIDSLGYRPGHDFSESVKMVEDEVRRAVREDVPDPAEYADRRVRVAP